jgi:hypothetical protein
MLLDKFSEGFSSTVGSLGFLAAAGLAGFSASAAGVAGVVVSSAIGINQEWVGSYNYIFSRVISYQFFS